MKKLYFIFALIISSAFADELLITEFMAKNDSTFTNQAGNFYDWIEIYNAGTSEVDLAAWFLTDDQANLQKWEFPSTNINAGAYMLVFASDNDKRKSGEELHTNFKLSSSGEFLALVKPDGITISHAYSPAFPQQVADVSYGLNPASQSEETLLESFAPCKAIVPENDSLGTNWLEKTFDDNTWMNGNTGVGYDTDPDYLPLINLDVSNSMYNINATCYIRIPFYVETASNYDSFILKMKYEDGFIAYLNGQKIAEANQPGNPTWNSAATTWHSDSQATNFVDYNIPLAPFKGGLIENGTNILAIHGLNQRTNSSDALFLPELAGLSYTGYNTNSLMYFVVPTPGAPNNVGSSNLPPIISEAGHSPLIPNAGDTITVTAKVIKTFHDISSVTLYYAAMFGGSTTVTMTSIGDEFYSGTIPSGIAAPGEMVRYFITAEDSESNVSRLPLFLTSESEEYFGTVIYDPAISTNLPVYHWFVQNTNAADTRTGTRCSFFYNGEFYDNIFCRLRGGSSASSKFPKRSHKFEFNDENEFKFSDKYKRADEFNLNAMYNDTAYMRDFLSWETLENSGVPYCYSTNVHVRQNGEFYGLEVHVEQIDGHYLRRLDFNDNGSLYKAAKNGTFLVPSDIENSKFEKKRPDDTNFVDLAELIAGLNLPSWNEKETYMFDNINIPEVVNYLAAHRLIMDWDYAHKNYYMYNDSDDSGEWYIFPWDKDLTFGYVWNGTNVFADNDYYGSDDGDGVSSMFFQQKNTLYSNIFFSTVFQQMYARRTRSLLDEFLQPPETPRENLIYEKRVYQLHDLMKTLADEDRAKWGWPTNSGFYNRDDHFDIDRGCVEITNDYFAPRRTHLYVTHSVDNGGIVPHAQPDDAAIIFGRIDFRPESGIKNQEYFELRNTNSFAVDISGWQISNAVSFVFNGGTVVPSNWSVFVSPDVKEFRARIESPKAGERNFVVGNYSGALSSRGETIVLINKNEDIVAVTNYPGLPITNQNFLRITEVMYHPIDSSLAPQFNDEDFEFIEIMNIGNDSVDINVIEIREGVTFDRYVPMIIETGAYALVIKNSEAFAYRYPTNTMNIAGEFSGSLENNGGELLELRDAQANNILSFGYVDSWYPETDGVGYSLEFINPKASTNTWGEKNSWRRSLALYGSPGGVVIPEPSLFFLLFMIYYLRKFISLR